MLLHLWASSPSLAPLCRPAASPWSLPNTSPVPGSLISPRALGWLPRRFLKECLRATVTSSKGHKDKSLELYWPGWWDELHQRQMLMEPARQMHPTCIHWLLCVISICHTKRLGPGTSVVVQWLRLHTPSAGDPGSIPGQGSKSHRPACHN